MKRITLLLILLPFLAHAQTVGNNNNQNKGQAYSQNTTTKSQGATLTAPPKKPQPKQFIYTAPPNQTFQTHNSQNYQKDIIFCKNELSKQRAFRLSPLVNQNEYINECVLGKSQYSIKKQTLNEMCKQDKNPQSCVNAGQSKLGTNSQRVSPDKLKYYQSRSQNNMQKQVAFCSNYLNKNTTDKKITAASRSQWLYECISAQTQLDIKKNTDQTKR